MTDITIPYSNTTFSRYLVIADTKFEFATYEEFTAARNMLAKVAILFNTPVKIKAIGKTIVISNRKLTVKINMYKLI